MPAAKRMPPKPPPPPGPPLAVPDMEPPWSEMHRKITVGDSRWMAVDHEREADLMKMDYWKLPLVCHNEKPRSNKSGRDDFNTRQCGCEAGEVQTHTDTHTFQHRFGFWFLPGILKTLLISDTIMEIASVLYIHTHIYVYIYI